MQYIEHIIEGIDGSQALFTGYIIDNSPEIDMDRRRPAVLVIPGGGYAMTSDREAEPIALKFVGAGYHAFTLRYSVHPSTYPTALIEASAAMALIREHADQWHINPDAVAVLGFSAGGHLAANLATTAGDTDIQAHGFEPDAVRPNALMLAYPVITSGAHAHRSSFEHLLGERAQDAALLRELSLEEHIDNRTPPVFVWHTISDDCVPVENTLLLVAACKRAEVSVEAHLFPEGGHGLSLATAETAWSGSGDTVPSVRQWLSLALSWTERTLAPLGA